MTAKDLDAVRDDIANVERIIREAGKNGISQQDLYRKSALTAHEFLAVMKGFVLRTGNVLEIALKSSDSAQQPDFAHYYWNANLTEEDYQKLEAWLAQNHLSKGLPKLE